MKTLIAFLVGLVLVPVLGGIYVLAGGFNTAATGSPGAIEKELAEVALKRSVKARAPKSTAPLPSSPEALRDGLDHYREMCVPCHGAPGVERNDMGLGLNPPAPDLTHSEAQSWSDGELFWIISHGIRMTGMPACSPTHDEEEIWKIAAFVRHLPDISDEEIQMLRSGGGEGEHHHGEEAAPPSQEEPAGEHEHQHGDEHGDGGGGETGSD